MNRTGEYLEYIASEMGASWLPRIYRDRILKMRTRAYQFPALARHAQTEIHHTLLGIELKAGRQRMLCPDLATARYLAVFARTALPAVAIPYDITTISAVADELESSWHRMLLLERQLARPQPGPADRALPVAFSAAAAGVWGWALRRHSHGSPAAAGRAAAGRRWRAGCRSSGGGLSAPALPTPT